MLEQRLQAGGLIHWILSIALMPVTYAGGGPLDVLVLYNQTSADAEAVAQSYQHARSLPTGHLCPVSGVSPSERSIPFETYETAVLQALDACLDRLPHADEIDYLVVTRGLPYRVALPDGFTTSLSAMLQVYRTKDGSDALLAGERARST